MEELQKEYERIQRYAAPFSKIGRYVMTWNEMAAISECERDTGRAISLAFRFGFEKGCRKTKKAVKA